MLYFICFRGDVSIWAPLLFCNKYQNYHQGLNHHLNYGKHRRSIFSWAKNQQVLCNPGRMQPIFKPKSFMTKTVTEDIKIGSCHGNWHAEDKHVDKKLQTDTKKLKEYIGLLIRDSVIQLHILKGVKYFPCEHQLFGWWTLTEVLLPVSCPQGIEGILYCVLNCIESGTCLWKKPRALRFPFLFLHETWGTLGSKPKDHPFTSRALRNMNRTALSPNNLLLVSLSLTSS